MPVYLVLVWLVGLNIGTYGPDNKFLSSSNERLEQVWKSTIPSNQMTSIVIILDIISAILSEK